MPNGSRCLPAVLIAVLLLPALPSTEAQLPEAGTTMMIRPTGLARLVPDPWLGGVWMGSQDGAFYKDLASGDLQHFHIRDGLPHQFVWDIIPTAEAVWFATQAGIARLDRATGTFDQVDREDGTMLVVTSRAILLEGSTLWVGTSQDGLFRVDTSSLRATAVPNPVDDQAFQHPIFGLAADGPELFVSAAGYGVVRWDRSTDQTTRYDFTYLQEDPQYTRIHLTTDRLWVGTYGDGLVAFDRDDGSPYEWASPGTVNALNVDSILQIGDELWFATNGGAARYTMSSDSWRSWMMGTTGEGSNDLMLAGGQIYAVNDKFVFRYDRQGDRWVYNEWWVADMTLRHNVVQSCLDEGDRLTFGTGGGGADYLDLRSGRWTVAGPNDGDNGQPRDINILDIATDGKAKYFATHNGVSELDLASRTYINYYTDGRTGDGHGQNLVKDVALDGDNAWFATSATKRPKFRDTDPDRWNPGNLVRMNKATHAMTAYDMGEGLSSNNVSVVEPDGNRLWVGSVLGGLDSFDKATGVATHVYPPGGKDTILDILVRPEGLWLATTGHGLVLLDPQTFDARQGPGFAEIPATSLGWADDLLWVGTASKGLRTVDVATLTIVDSYTTGMPSDLFTNCFLQRGNLLYIGTDNGVERMDLAQRLFLPQISKWDAATALAKRADQTSSLLTIVSPASGERPVADQPIAVSGTATAPAGARVFVRADDWPWTQATGVDSWSATLPADPARGGSVTIAAKLESGGQVLALVTRTLAFASEDADVPAKLDHTPLLEVRLGDAPTLTVKANRTLDDLSGLVFFRRPGGLSFETLPMGRDASGVLTATLPQFDTAGFAEYRILVDWTGGAARLPDPLGGFGPSYTLLVNSRAGLASAAVVAAELPELTAGSEATIAVAVQNSGSRDADMELTFDGPAAAWLVDAPTTLHVPAGESREISLRLEVPAEAKAGTHALDVAAGVDPLIGSSGQERLLLTVAGAGGDAPATPKGAPVPVAVVLAALAVALLARRRSGL